MGGQKGGKVQLQTTFLFWALKNLLFERKSSSILRPFHNYYVFNHRQRFRFLCTFMGDIRWNKNRRCAVKAVRSFFFSLYLMKPPTLSSSSNLELAPDRENNGTKIQFHLTIIWC